MSRELTLKAYRVLCDETNDLLLEENGILRHTAKPPEAEFLERKRRLLERLSSALNDLKSAALEREIGKSQEYAQEIQKKLMKIFLLDKENEQLLLKCSMSLPVLQRPRPVNTQMLQKAYQQNMRNRGKESN